MSPILDNINKNLNHLKDLVERKEKPLIEIYEVFTGETFENSDEYKRLLNKGYLSFTLGESTVKWYTYAILGIGMAIAIAGTFFTCWLGGFVISSLGQSWAYNSLKSVISGEFDFLNYIGLPSILNIIWSNGIYFGLKECLNFLHIQEFITWTWTQSFIDDSLHIVKAVPMYIGVRIFDSLICRISQF